MASSTLLAAENRASSAARGSRPRIRTLDGWRAVAILLVLFEHAAVYSRFHKQIWANLGNFGVDVFFVISGYIITLRLIEERKKTGDVCLRSFYLRRAFRILPLVAVYLSVLCVLSAFGRLVDLRWPEVLGSALFFRNYQLNWNPSGAFTTHFWSLSIEEHFYLLWPALFVWLGNRRALGVALAGAASCALWRAYALANPHILAGHLQFVPSPGVLIWRTDMRCDGLLLGCSMAILLSWEPGRSFVLRNFPKETPIFLLTLLVLNLGRTQGWPSLSTYVLVALLLVSTSVVEEGLVHRWLNYRWLAWIGTISYSIYVWQQVFFFRPDGEFLPMGILSTFPFNLVCVFALSALSYRFLERSFIRLGRRFQEKRQRQEDAELVVS
jgi:peptidoglycan/LPS O-acetylase OafA/YrhL